mgnify:CR=1 FL=1
MKLFADVEECRQVISSYMNDFSKENQIRMQITIDNCGFLPKRKQIYNMTYTFRSCLWDIPEAVDIGFHSWLKQNIPSRIEALRYYKVIK